MAGRHITELSEAYEPKGYKISQMSLVESQNESSLGQPSVGDLAPEFEVRAVTGAKKHKVQLKDYRGKKHVVLAFHVANWTPV